MPDNSFKLELVAHKALVCPESKSEVRHLVFKRTDGKKLDYQAGQFITFIIDGERRSYSLANPPGESGSDELEVAISQVYDEDGQPGLATKVFFKGEACDEPDPGPYEAVGPKGRLVLPRPVEGEPVICKRYIFIATGTGVTPYRAMLSELDSQFDAGECSKAILLFGVRQPEDLLYEKDFLDYEKSHQTQFEFYPCYSRCEGELPAEQPHACKGYVTKQLEAIELNSETDRVFLCGNPKMVDDCFNYLREEKDFPIKQIIREKYVSPKKRSV